MKKSLFCSSQRVTVWCVYIDISGETEWNTYITIN